MKSIILTTDEVRQLPITGEITIKRLVKPQPQSVPPNAYMDAYNKSDRWCFWLSSKEPAILVAPKGKACMWECPYGQPGDHLWVREAWHTDVSDLEYAKAKHEDVMSDSPIFYKADKVNEGAGCIWRLPTHMPRWASRYTVENKGVEVKQVEGQWHWFVTLRPVKDGES